MSAEDDTQPLDPRELQDDPQAPAPNPAPAPVPSVDPAPTPQKDTKMSFDWSWFKNTGLAAVQHASSAFLSVSGGDALNLWHFDYKAALGVTAGAALASVLQDIVKYKRPSAT